MRSIVSIGRTTVLLALLTCASTREAGADWLITPFVGATFAGDTTFLDLDQAASTKTFVYGVSGSWLSDRVFGVEAEFAHAPAFFETDGSTLPNVVSSSNMLTVSGNVIAAVPLSVTRESLRPYVTGGVGLLHASLTGIGAIFSEDGDGGRFARDRIRDLPGPAAKSAQPAGPVDENPPHRRCGHAVEVLAVRIQHLVLQQPLVDGVHEGRGLQAVGAFVAEKPARLAPEFVVDELHHRVVRDLAGSP